MGARSLAAATAGGGGYLDVNLWAVVVATVHNAVGNAVETVAEGVVVSIFIVVTHLVVDDNLGRLNVGFDANALLEVWLVAGAVLTLGNVDCRV